MKTNLLELINSCKNYERNAQRQVMNLLAPTLYNICRRYEKSHPKIQDLVQESLILVFNNIEHFKGGDEKSFNAWSKRIAINLCLQQFRKARIINESLDLATDYTILPDIFGTLGVEEILKLLFQLPENQRVVFNLFVIDGYTHAEVAEILQINESHSRTLLTRARGSLQNLISEKTFYKN